MLILQGVHELVRQRRVCGPIGQVGGEVHLLVVRLVKSRELRFEKAKGALFVIEIGRDETKADQ